MSGFRSFILNTEKVINQHLTTNRQEVGSLAKPSHYQETRPWGLCIHGEYKHSNTLKPVVPCKHTTSGGASLFPGLLAASYRNACKPHVSWAPTGQTQRLPSSRRHGG